MINNKGMGKTNVDFSSIQFIFTYYPIIMSIDTQNIYITVPCIMHATGILTLPYLRRLLFVKSSKYSPETKSVAMSL